jgi:hypothetical protein
MFPCNNCLVKACCGSYCDKLIKDEMVIALYLLTYRTCPDCGNHLVESSPNGLMMMCKKCRKAFTRHIRKRDSDYDLPISISSTVSAGSSTSVQSNIIHLGPELISKHLIKSASKYQKVSFPRKLKPKRSKVQYIEAGKVEISNNNDIVLFRRMSVKYSETIMKNVNQHIKSKLLLTEEIIEKAKKLSPEWIFKHRDLFIKDPREDFQSEDECQTIVI